jgi:hypothetical protein
MRSATAFVVVFVALAGGLFLALELTPTASWQVFEDGPTLYEELAAEGLTTPDGLLGPDGLPAGNFVIVAGDLPAMARRLEGMFRSHDAAEQFLASKLRLPEDAPGWQRGVIRVIKDFDATGLSRVVAQTEYRNPSRGAHILATQSSSGAGFEVPSRARSHAGSRTG